MFLLLAAAAIGSFLATCVSRAARQVSVFGAVRSSCPTCGAIVPAYALLPILGFLVLRGRCGDCGARIDPLHPMMEAATVAMCVSALWVAGWLLTLEAACGLALGTALVFLASHDARTGRLPDVVTLPLIVAGLAVSAWLERVDFSESALGVILGGAGGWAVSAAYRQLRGREGLGMGDVKLVAGLGAWLGAGALPGLLLVASASALAVLFVRAVSGRRISRHARIVFGPFLALAGWVLWLAGA
ncbi:A24 family peptidase [Nisaea acidiphila]|uniref:Prepilin leader peptidase/N-methyltransferase n=1 Tax=Nisaea acidiphila TaxID=1862145 RepID=A0A9J7AYA2_9PROT|nr:A24 family peptidase [Nisaea acidiphila]UUX52248.1 A24 family peptidase [Nisaea acidiphila]